MLGDCLCKAPPGQMQLPTAGAASAGSRVINLINSCSLHMFQLITSTPELTAAELMSQI